MNYEAGNAAKYSSLSLYALSSIFNFFASCHTIKMMNISSLHSSRRYFKGYLAAAVVAGKSKLEQKTIQKNPANISHSLFFLAQQLAAFISNVSIHCPLPRINLFSPTLIAISSDQPLTPKKRNSSLLIITPIYCHNIFFLSIPLFVSFCLLVLLLINISSGMAQQKSQP